MRHFYKLLLTTALLFTTNAFAAEPEAVIYKRFIETKNGFLSASFSKTNFQQKVNSYYTALENDFDRYAEVVKNQKQAAEKIYQLAYEIELFDPLKALAESKMTKADCRSAFHLNKIASNGLDKNENQKIEKILKTICN